MTGSAPANSHDSSHETSVQSIMKEIWVSFSNATKLISIACCLVAKNPHLAPGEFALLLGGKWARRLGPMASAALPLLALPLPILGRRHRRRHLHCLAHLLGCVIREVAEVRAAGDLKGHKSPKVHPVLIGGRKSAVHQPTQRIGGDGLGASVDARLDQLAILRRFDACDGVVVGLDERVRGFGRVVAVLDEVNNAHLPLRVRKRALVELRYEVVTPWLT
jgi:hypothetical protein